MTELSDDARALLEQWNAILRRGLNQPQPPAVRPDELSRLADVPYLGRGQAAVAELEQAGYLRVEGNLG